MKRKVFTGIIVILVLLLGSCDFLQPEKTSEEVEYTDVVYSYDKDGTTQITLYLDGVGVPKTAEQRALFRDLAVMTHDYFEVIFVDYTVAASPVIARAAWELGANAGISGVSRDATGKNYTNVRPVTGATPVPTAACIFVGRKSDMTLLGVGHMIQVDRATHTATTNLLNTNSKSVTFQVVALNTKLTATPSTAVAGTYEDQPGKMDGGSFWLGNAYDALAATPAPVAPSDTITDGRAQWTSLEGVAYPMFNLDKFDTTTAVKQTTQGVYKFFGPFASVGADASQGRPVASIDMSAAVLCDRGTAAAPLTPEVIKRDPRFLAGGQTWYVQTSRKDTTTKVAFYTPKATTPALQETDIEAQFGAIGATTATPFPHAGIKFYFTVGKASDNGVFSFVFQVPVFMAEKTPPTNGGPEYKTWYIRPGFSTDQYNLDNGVDAGGGVLMGVGVKGLDWLQIFVTGLGFTL